MVSAHAELGNSDKALELVTEVLKLEDRRREAAALQRTADIHVSSEGSCAR